MVAVRPLPGDPEPRGLRRPAPTRTTSPGTNSAAGIWRSFPSRRTWADGTAARCRAVSACSAFHSVRKPTAAFRTMTTSTATASMFSPIGQRTMVAPNSRATIRLLNWSTTSKTDRPFASARAFGPNCRAFGPRRVGQAGAESRPGGPGDHFRRQRVPGAWRLGGGAGLVARGLGRRPLRRSVGAHGILQAGLAVLFHGTHASHGVDVCFVGTRTMASLAVNFLTAEPKEGGAARALPPVPFRPGPDSGYMTGQVCLDCTADSIFPGGQ